MGNPMQGMGGPGMDPGYDPRASLSGGPDPKGKKEKKEKK